MSPIVQTKIIFGQWGRHIHAYNCYYGKELNIIFSIIEIDLCVIAVLSRDREEKILTYAKKKERKNNKCTHTHIHIYTYTFHVVNQIEFLQRMSVMDENNIFLRNVETLNRTKSIDRAKSELD